MPKWHSKESSDLWRWKGTGSPPLEPVASPPRTPPPPRMPPLPRTPPLPRMPPPFETPYLPVMPPAPPGDTDRYESHELDGMPYRCVYIHSPLPNTQCFNHNAYAIKILFQISWVHDLLCGNTTDIDVEDKSSLLRESDSEDKHWL